MSNNHEIRIGRASYELACRLQRDRRSPELITDELFALLQDEHKFISDALHGFLKGHKGPPEWALRKAITDFANDLVNL